MRKILILVAIFFTSLMFSQELDKFILSTSNFNQIEIPTKLDTPQSYTMVLEWISLNFNQKNEYVQNSIENKKIRMYSKREKFWFYKGLFKTQMTTDFFINFEFKEGVIIMKPVLDNFYEAKTDKVTYSFQTFFKKDGSTQKSWIDSKEMIESKFNEFAKSLHYFILAN